MSWPLRSGEFACLAPLFSCRGSGCTENNEGKDPRLQRTAELVDDIEILRSDFPRGQFRAVLFDFDGTLSLIRAGWQQIMIPMMVEILRQTGTHETEASLTTLVGDYVMRLNGRP